jgi:hypothetical protein
MIDVTYVIASSRHDNSSLLLSKFSARMLITPLIWYIRHNVTIMKNMSLISNFNNHYTALVYSFCNNICLTHLQELTWQLHFCNLPDIPLLLHTHTHLHTTLTQLHVRRELGPGRYAWVLKEGRRSLSWLDDQFMPLPQVVSNWFSDHTLTLSLHGLLK